jgi:hypothetical protein
MRSFIVLDRRPAMKVEVSRAEELAPFFLFRRVSLDLPIAHRRHLIPSGESQPRR